MDSVLTDLRQARALIDKALVDLRHDLPPWWHTALGEVGVREQPGSDHHPRILEYLATCHRDNGGNLGNWAAQRDETAWCSAFVNWVLLRQELPVTRSAAALSWRNWGRQTPPRRGAIAVLTRPGGGHVAFLGRVEGDQAYLCGGNQANSVSIRPYPVSRVLTYRWPV